MNDLDLILADDIELLDYVQHVAQTRNWRDRLARVRRIRPDVAVRLQSVLGGKGYRVGWGEWGREGLRWVRELDIQTQKAGDAFEITPPKS